MRSKRIAFVAAGVIAIVVLLGVIFRAQLAGVPGVGRLIGTTPSPPVAASAYVCPMHPEVRSDKPGKCPKCGMDLVKEGGPGVAPASGAAGAVAVASSSQASNAGDSHAPQRGAPRAGVSLDLRRQQLIGVRTATVARKPIDLTIRTVGLIRYDETRQADVNLKVEGFVRDLRVNTTGEYVRRGQPLLTLYSPELLATQNEYLLALKTRDQLASSQVGDARAYAERLANAARQRLALWDLSDADIARLEQTREPQAAVTFRSPVSGYVIEKRVVEGQRIMTGESLYRIADLSVVWVEADVYERELARVKVGERASVSVEAWPGEVFAGRITYIYPYVAEETRSVKVRLALPNRNGRLKPGMYVTVQFNASTGAGLTVPADAIIDSGPAQFAFVAQGDGYFDPRQVKVGHRLGDEVEVRSGLKEGDVVASAATFFIDSESQLRAAMQGYEPPAAPTAAGGATAPASAVDISLRTEPDPPRNGDNAFIVTVREAGKPVDGAEVSVRLYMPPMPSMNMPAMSAEAKLLPQGNGTYRGRGNVPMAGRWDTTVTVSRQGTRLGSRRFALVAR